jgi:D-threo-aldose 1-dehydrogenase
VRAAEGVVLKGTSVRMTRLGVGTAMIGGLFSEVATDDALRTLERAFEHGIAMFDTAPLYGLGNAERRLGTALAGWPRSAVTISTKVGRLLRTVTPEGAASQGLDLDDAHPVFWGAGPERAVWDFSYAGVMRSLEESLARLNTDRIDIVYIHDPEDHMDEAVTSAYRALADLRDQGVIGAIGVGLDHSWIGVRFARETDVDCLLVSGRCTLLDRDAIGELLPLCAERGISVIACSVFNSGILADPSGNPHYWYAPADPSVIAQARRLERICARYEVPLRAAAVQFPFRHPAVVAVLVGARLPETVDDTVSMLDVSIPEELWDELESDDARAQA